MWSTFKSPPIFSSQTKAVNAYKRNSLNDTNKPTPGAMPWPLLTSCRPLQILPRQTERYDCLEFEFSAFPTTLHLLNVCCLKSYFFKLCWSPPLPPPTHPPGNPETIKSFDISLLCVFEHFSFQGPAALLREKPPLPPPSPNMRRSLWAKDWSLSFESWTFPEIDTNT